MADDDERKGELLWWVLVCAVYLLGVWTGIELFPHLFGKPEPRMVTAPPAWAPRAPGPAR